MFENKLNYIKNFLKIIGFGYALRFGESDHYMTQAEETNLVHQNLIQINSSNSNQDLTENQRIVEIDRNLNTDRLCFKINRGGALSDKTGPGAKAKNKVRKNSKTKGTNIVQGRAEAFSPNRLYHISPLKDSKVLQEKKLFSDNQGYGFNKLKSAKRTSASRKSNLGTLVINSPDTNQNVIITQKDIRKWITPQERARTGNQKLNEDKVREKYINVVRNPDKVVEAIHPNDGGRRCLIYQKQMKEDSKTINNVVIADKDTNRAILGSELTVSESLNLESTNKLNLFDMRRDPQTLVMNEKGIKELDSLTKARENGFLEKINQIRRPFNESETKGDFVGVDSVTGKKIDIHIKAIHPTSPRSVSLQMEDINKHLKSLLKYNSRQEIVIYDGSNVADFLHDTIKQKVSHELNMYQLDKIKFVF